MPYLPWGFGGEAPKTLLICQYTHFCYMPNIGRMLLPRILDLILEGASQEKFVDRMLDDMLLSGAHKGPIKNGKTALLISGNTFKGTALFDECSGQLREVTMTLEPLFYDQMRAAGKEFSDKYIPGVGEFAWKSKLLGMGFKLIHKDSSTIVSFSEGLLKPCTVTFQK
jgi:hypothetical protein